MQDKVKAPAIIWLVAVILSMLWAVLSIVINLAGAGASFLPQAGGGEAADQAAALFSGGVGVVIAVVGLIGGGVSAYASLQMMKLKSHTLCVVGAIIAMIPCFSPCCVLGLPGAIWALITLLDKDVKAAFS